MTDAQARLAAALSDRYRIEREIGAGGMATVYLAEDLKHQRQVAIKVLRPELGAVIGAERFLAEIRTTANLQHPHILGLIDSGEVEGQLYYVMPFIEGESLRDRLSREKQLPIDDATRITTEVASALDYAHRHGVIHRDIKPENILLHDGRALVADFGIALAASKAGGARMTETGMSLGTPHYMSPEQAMGERELTARSDVYALGCVLYEMLTGDPPFTGSTAQAILARVVTEAPRPMIPQRHTIPPQVEAATLTALEKLPADRFATAKEFADALSRPHVPTATRPHGLTSSRRAVALPVLAVTTVLSLLAAAWAFSRAGRTDPPTSWRYISLGDSVSVSAVAPSLALSPDGATLVIKDNTQDGLLWAKRAGALNPIAIAGTEHASSPAFSPDGEWIAFIANQQLRKVRLSGGAVTTLADSAAGSARGFGFGGVAWLEDGTLVYVSPDFNRLIRVSASGGSGTVLLDNTGLQGQGFNYPMALSGTRGLLVQVCNSGCGIMSLRVLDLRTGKLKLLLNEAAQAWYLPTGHLVYVRRDGAALAAPFDLDRLELTGPAVAVLDRVVVTRGFAQLTASPSGSVVYARGEGGNDENTMVRVARDGMIALVDSAWTGRFSSVAIAPDGRRLAVGAGTGTGGLNIWIKQLDRGPSTRLSFGGGDRRPVWSPDGRMLAFIRDTLGTSIVAARFADGSRPDTVLVRLSQMVQEVDWSRDGRWLVVRTDNAAEGAGNLIGVRTNGDTTPVVLVSSPFTELNPAISPDGLWLAYASNESGRNEVYVRPFPNTADGRWQVSTAGGVQPRWAPDSRELYYLDAASQLIAARVTTSPTFAITELHPLFNASLLSLDPFHQSYDVMPDGRYFLFASPRQSAAASRAPTLVRVDGWFRDLRARLAQ